MYHFSDKNWKLFLWLKQIVEKVLRCTSLEKLYLHDEQTNTKYNTIVIKSCNNGYNNDNNFYFGCRIYEALAKAPL